MDPDSAAATIFSAFRLKLDRRILPYLLGPLAEEALTETSRGGPAHAARLRAHFVHLMDQGDVSMLPPEPGGWEALIGEALTAAVEELSEQLGPDLTKWQWGRVHHTAPKHPLSEVYPEAADLLDPPSVTSGGDGDTPQAASYSPAQPYTIASTSVLRYIYDLSGLEQLPLDSAPRVVRTSGKRPLRRPGPDLVGGGLRSHVVQLGADSGVGGILPDSAGVIDGIGESIGTNIES